MPIVDLNRRFHEWNDEEPPDPDLSSALGLDDGGIGWDQLLTKRRAVILAEAGSGKSTEFAERARLTAHSNAYVFHASVEDVGSDGLDESLSVDARSKLSQWRKAVDDAWFFIDSVDEAKVAGIKFERVARKLSDGIHGAEERCHVFLSCRVTDWHPQRDREALKRWLPVSSVIRMPEPTPEDELLRIIRSEPNPNQEGPPNEEPFIAIMAQLDPERVRLFAKAKGVSQIEQFLKAIDDADLWHFARRPLDLDWLVRLWQAEGRMGTLQEMVGLSINERLKETNPDRARNDDLNNVIALRAVERIGAAMVFGRRTTVAIPDGPAELALDSALDLADILPDWSADDRIRLLTRPIFDPATFGRVRFHNDNDGIVRSFLTARWLVRLREANLPTGELFRLLFANSYGLELIRPSLNETAAWLCLWDKDVANEVVRLAPGLLLRAGDPASLSPNIRSEALSALLRELTTDEKEWPWWDNDKLRRFAQQDLGTAVVSLWPQYRSNRAASQLLMRLAWLGALKECEILAHDVAFDSEADQTLRVFAGRALLAMAGLSKRSDYAALIKENTATLPLRMVCDAVIDLVPTLIATSDVLRILTVVNIEDDENGLDFRRDGIALAKRLEGAADLEIFLAWLLEQLGTELGDTAHHPPTKREEILFPSMAQAALRLLKATPQNEAPEVAIHALLRIGNGRERGASVPKDANEALVELHRTVERRRRAFWKVVTTLRTVPQIQLIDHVRHIEHLGYQTGLKIDDVEWLLADGLAKGGMDCRLAVSAALLIYRSHGKPTPLLSKIAETIESNPLAKEAFRACTTPRTPSRTELEMDQKHQEIRNQKQAERDKQDQSWIQLIRDIQSDPDRIAKLKQPIPQNQCSDLIFLWRLLHGAGSHSRYAPNSIAPLERIAGSDVAKAAEAGLIALWRTCEPLVRSRREPQERNSVRWADLMGLAGVTLEAAKDPAWATKLSDGEARRATEFATLEINGFPQWLSDLVVSRPAAVTAVLHHEIKDELTRQGVTFFKTLQDVTYADDGLASLLAPVLLHDLEASLSVPDGAVSRVLQIIVNGLAESDRERFARWGIAKFQFAQERDVGLAVPYLAAVFSINPRAATSVFVTQASALDERAQTNLVDRFLIACFGDSISATTFKPVTATPADVTEELLLLSFKTYKQVAARQRRGGAAYHSNDVDYADHAREAVFSRFVKTPGSATYHALRQLQHDSTCPLPPTRLGSLAEQRAAEDSESAPWPPGEAYEFEQSRETAPRTGKDLRSVLVGRIEDMQHELLHDDFSQGQTLKQLPSEKEVQKWMAYHLRLKQGRSFSVERDPRVIDEKEPDIRIRANATDASVSLEIKVAESWSLSELDNALAVQLCGYLRSDKYGVLLLVHQKARLRGWRDTAGNYLTFAEVVDRLRARALAISGESHSSPQPVVAVLDVSGVS